MNMRVFPRSDGDYGLILTEGADFYSGYVVMPSYRAIAVYARDNFVTRVSYSQDMTAYEQYRIGTELMAMFLDMPLIRGK